MTLQAIDPPAKPTLYPLACTAVPAALLLPARAAATAAAAAAVCTMAGSLVHLQQGRHISEPAKSHARTHPRQALLCSLLYHAAPHNPLYCCAWFTTYQQQCIYIPENAT
jgi:hypothetical protein